MAVETVTSPPMLDATGQTIVTKLDAIKNAVQPTNACTDIDIAIPASGWSGSPYTYTYTNAHITAGCAVKVNFLEGSADTKALNLEYEKVTNGVRFTTTVKPTAEIKVRLHVLNADATSVVATTADAVSTSAVSGQANVEGALGALSEQIASYEFTNEYSSILAMVNDQVTTKGKSLPFSFVKTGSVTLSDTPSSIGSAEFTGIVYGNDQRLEVCINQYGADDDFRREIFNGAWRTNDWYSLSDKIGTKLNVYGIGGNTTYELVTVVDVPSAIMIISYEEAWLISQATNTSPITKTLLTAETSTGLSVNGRNITFGVDVNRKYFVFCPNGYELHLVP